MKTVFLVGVQKTLQVYGQCSTRNPHKMEAVVYLLIKKKKKERKYCESNWLSTLNPNLEPVIRSQASLFYASEPICFFGPFPLVSS